MEEQKMAAVWPNVQWGSICWCHLFLIFESAIFAVGSKSLCLIPCFQTQMALTVTDLLVQRHAMELTL